MPHALGETRLNSPHAYVSYAFQLTLNASLTFSCLSFQSTEATFEPENHDKELDFDFADFSEEELGRKLVM